MNRKASSETEARSWFDFGPEPVLCSTEGKEPKVVKSFTEVQEYFHDAPVKLNADADEDGFGSDEDAGESDGPGYNTTDKIEGGVN